MDSIYINTSPIFSRCQECFVYKHRILELEEYIYKLENKLNKSYSDIHISDVVDSVNIFDTSSDESKLPNYIISMLRNPHRSLKELTVGTTLEIIHIKRLKNDTYKILAKNGNTYISDKENRLFIEKIIDKGYIVYFEENIYSPIEGDVIYKISKIGMKQGKNVYSVPECLCGDFVYEQELKIYIPYKGGGFVIYTNNIRGVRISSNQDDITNVKKRNFIKSFLVDNIENVFIDDKVFSETINRYDKFITKPKFKKCLAYAHNNNFDIIVKRIQDIFWEVDDLVDFVDNILSKCPVNIYIIKRQNKTEKRLPDIIPLLEYLGGSHYDIIKSLDKQCKTSRDIEKHGSIQGARESRWKEQQQRKKDDNSHFYIIDDTTKPSKQLEWLKVAKNSIDIGLDDLLSTLLNEDGEKGVASRDATARYLNSIKHIYPPARGRQKYTGTMVRDIRKECHRMRVQDIWKIDDKKVTISEEVHPPYRHPREVDYPETLPYAFVEGNVSDNIDPYRQDVISFQEFEKQRKQDMKKRTS